MILLIDEYDVPLAKASEKNTPENRYYEHVVSYASALLYDRNTKPKNYWRNISGNGIIRDFVGRDDLDVTGKFETLMSGGSILGGGYCCCDKVSE